MGTYNLTQRQRDLLRVLIDGIKNKNWSETFLDVSTMSGHAIMPMQGGDSIPIEELDDMNVIASTGLVLVQRSSKGTPRFTVTQAAYEAVDQDFQIPENPRQGNQYIGVQVQGSVAGSVQGIGYADETEVKQIVNDPVALHAELEKITSALIDAVKNELDGSQLADYAGSIKQLKEALEDKVAGKSKFRKLISTISFVNDTSSSFELMAKAWPYISVLLQLAAQIFAK